MRCWNTVKTSWMKYEDMVAGPYFIKLQLRLHAINHSFVVTKLYYLGT